MSQQLAVLQGSIQEYREQLLAHPVYGRIDDLAGLKKFTQVHVFAVWDFMSLLKSLQNGLTCVDIPWQPVGNANTRYLINEIVLGEESDVDELGNRTSHFELYLSAMKQMDADTAGITDLLVKLNSGVEIREAIKQLDISDKVRAFLHFTFDIILDAPLHVQAAVFTFGREDLIPSMFMQLLEKLYQEIPEKISVIKYYIERHIEVDGGHHSHLALAMVQQLCGDDEKKWKEATKASQKALEMRMQLWDAVIE